MTPYFIEQALCLAMLLALYHLIFEREKMHLFNRFYLLGSLGIAIGIPFIEIETAPETVLPVIATFSQATTQSRSAVYATPVFRDEPGFFAGWILPIYVTVGVFLTWRFANNLLRLRSAIIGNQAIPYQNARLLLLREKVLPHTFLHYIFVNKADYDKIDHKLLVHELAHVRQNHSLDILLIELLQIIFWFNPLIYCYKKAIKLNHEFLADEAVIQSCRDVAAYQRLLLNQTALQPNASLASHSTYTRTKKRFRMMTKTTSPMRALLKQAALLPVLMLLIFAFNTRMLAQESVRKTEKPKPTNSTKLGEEMYYGKVTMQQAREIFYNRKGFFRVVNGIMVDKKYKDLTAEEKSQLRNPPPPPVKNSPTQAQLNAWLDSKVYGVWLDNKRVKNSELQKYRPGDFGTYSESIVTRTAKNYGKHQFQVDVSTHREFEQFRKEWLAQFGIAE